MISLRERVGIMFPRLLSQTYCVPPVFLNRVQYSRQTIAGQDVLVLGNPNKSPGQSPAPKCSVASGSAGSNQGSEAELPEPPKAMWSKDTESSMTPVRVFASQIREDFAQQHVLHCLRTFGETESEPMFVLSQLKFKVDIAEMDPAVAELLPSVSDPKPNRNVRGDFDVLIVHRHYGVLVGELKSVGLNADVLSPGEVNEKVAERIVKAADQLKKSVVVMRHLMSDLPSNISVRKCLIFPYISRDQLLAIALNHELETALCASLEAKDAAEAAKLCMCADDMSSVSTPWDVTRPVLNKLREWWDNRMVSDRGSVMSEDDYVELVARLCGPVIAVEIYFVLPPRMDVRTVGEAASELGRQLSRLVLTQEQVDLLHRAPPNVCLTGPPGTGKSLVLAVRALISVREEGRYVIVLSSNPFSLAVSKLIFRQLQMTLKAGDDGDQMASRVLFFYYDLRANPECVDEIVQRFQEILGQIHSTGLCVLMDEANFCEGRVGEVSQELVRKVTDLFQERVCLWAACLKHTNIPAALQEEKLTVPLRCAPSVCREVNKGLNQISDVNGYSSEGTVSPSDGLCVIVLRHQGTGHTGAWPVDCFRCGQEIGEKLIELREQVTAIGSNRSLPELHYRDIFVLTRSSNLHETVIDENGQVRRQASDVVRGLRDKNIPVGVLGWRRDDLEQWKKDLDDMAIAESDRVTVARWRAVDGLERKVVVYLPGRDESVDQPESEESVEADDRLRLVSRCTTQLIMVDVPHRRFSGDPGAEEGQG